MPTPTQEILPMVTLRYTTSGFIRNFVISGDTQQEVMDKIEAMYANYPTAGYGTTIGEIQLERQWFANGYHYRSCD